MTATLLTLTLVLALGPAQPTYKGQPRKPSPVAPSLPLLTDEEEDELDRIIDRFIASDIGKLTGEEARKAKEELKKLGPPAIPALIRGLNRAAKLEQSCPALILAKRLSDLLNRTDDLELLEFARENIGAGVQKSRHMGALRSLRGEVVLRKGLVTRARNGLGGQRTLRQMSVSELATAAGSERGPKLKAVLMELATRQGDEAIAALGTAASAYEGDVQQLARDLLVKNLSRLAPSVIKAKLKDDKAEVRAAAARVAGAKGLRLGGELIDLLNDDDASVRDAAHAALVKLARGTDHGPGSQAVPEERAEAIKKWRNWWAKQGGR